MGEGVLRRREAVDKSPAGGLERSGGYARAAGGLERSGGYELGESAVPEDTSDSTLYLKTYKSLALANKLTISAEKLGIVWGENHRYWQIKDHEGSHSGHIAHLASVCWFDVRYSIRGVPRGRYRPTWRLRLDQYANELADIALSATVEEQTTSSPLSQSTTTLRTLAESSTRSWVRFYLPTIDVGMEMDDAEYHTVHLVMEDHRNTWKYGMDIDFVRLERVDLVGMEGGWEREDGDGREEEAQEEEEDVWESGDEDGDGDGQ
ncbi:hypothetical protein HDV00_005475 [Rhizophlyctis rosea]|nr:hypothetical protein HDV00_005475 [Rhizophlyctis rosea]